VIALLSARPPLLVVCLGYAQGTNKHKVVLVALQAFHKSQSLLAGEEINPDLQLGVTSLRSRRVLLTFYLTGLATVSCMGC